MVTAVDLKNMKLHEVKTVHTSSQQMDTDKRRESVTTVMKVEGGYIYKMESWVTLAQIGRIELKTTDATATSVFVPEQ